MKQIGLFLCMLIVAFGTQPSLAKRKAKVPITPGPTVMTEHEKGIQANPDAGIEHAVILVHETELDEDVGANTKRRFHLRAKILSNEGRDLADIELPWLDDNSKLVEWWGRTILPDGEVYELSRAELDSQVIGKDRRSEVKSFRAALPGVVPGCIIDYGYEVKSASFQYYNRVPLQRAYPIEKLLYRWIPWTGFQGAYIVNHGSMRHPVDVDIDKGRITVVAANLPPALKEEYMPPKHATDVSIIFYYLFGSARYEHFWDDKAKSIDHSASMHFGKTRYLKKAVEAIGIDPQAPVETRLQAVYDWVTANVSRLGLKSFEQVEDKSDEGKDRYDYVRKILESKEGSSYEVAVFYLALARYFGCEAHLVYVADRTENFWDRKLKSLYQFDSTLVAVRRPGDPEKKYVVLDPGSGLPFGEIPWYYSGVNGYLLTREGADTVRLQPAPITSNISETTVAIHFEEENEFTVYSWTALGRGQISMDERRYLRWMSPEDRSERIEKLCSTGTESEILTAEVGNLQELTSDYELQCKAEESNGLDESIGHYSMSFVGPWMKSVPGLTEGERILTVVFRFPRADITRMDVSAPEGFTPHDSLPTKTIESTFGKYVLSIKRTDEGYHVERLLALYPLAVPAEHYNELVEFLDSVRKADRTNLEFERAGT